MFALFVFSMIRVLALNLSVVILVSMGARRPTLPQPLSLPTRNVVTPKSPATFLCLDSPTSTLHTSVYSTPTFGYSTPPKHVPYPFHVLSVYNSSVNLASWMSHSESSRLFGHIGVSHLYENVCQAPTCPSSFLMSCHNGLSPETTSLTFEYYRFAPRLATRVSALRSMLSNLNSGDEDEELPGSVCNKHTHQDLDMSSWNATHLSEWQSIFLRSDLVASEEHRASMKLASMVFQYPQLSEATPNAHWSSPVLRCLGVLLYGLLFLGLSAQSDALFALAVYFRVYARQVIIYLTPSQVCSPAVLYTRSEVESILGNDTRYANFASLIFHPILPEVVALYLPICAKPLPAIDEKNLDSIISNIIHQLESLQPLGDLTDSLAVQHTEVTDEVQESKLLGKDDEEGHTPNPEELIDQNTVGQTVNDPVASSSTHGNNSLALEHSAVCVDPSCDEEVKDRSADDKVMVDSTEIMISLPIDSSVGRPSGPKVPQDDEADVFQVVSHKKASIRLRKPSPDKPTQSLKIRKYRPRIKEVSEEELFPPAHSKLRNPPPKRSVGQCLAFVSYSASAGQIRVAHSSLGSKGGSLLLSSHGFRVSRDQDKDFLVTSPVSAGNVTESGTPSKEEFAGKSLQNEYSESNSVSCSIQTALNNALPSRIETPDSESALLAFRADSNSSDVRSLLSTDALRPAHPTRAVSLPNSKTSNPLFASTSLSAALPPRSSVLTITEPDNAHSALSESSITMKNNSRRRHSKDYSASKAMSGNKQSAHSVSSGCRNASQRTAGMDSLTLTMERIRKAAEELKADGLSGVKL